MNTNTNINIYSTNAGTKIRRAQALAATAAVPAAFDCALRSIPAVVVEKVTAPALAALIDAMRAQFVKGRDQGRHEIRLRLGINR